MAALNGMLDCVESGVEQPRFLHPEPVDVDALTGEIYEKVRKLADRDFVLQCSAIGTAVLDPQRITQALDALADNACCFTRPGG